MLTRTWSFFGRRAPQRRAKFRPANPANRVPPLRLESLEGRRLLAVTAPAAGTWTQLAAQAPGGSGTMMLLTDGTVMMQGSGVSDSWYRLTPDASGNYVNGTWSTLAKSGLPRLYTGNNLLPNGNVFVLGGEYSGANGNKNFANSGEIYNPVTNSWKPIKDFPQSRFGDDPTVLLPNGKILAGYLSGPQTYLYDPSNDTWTQTGSKLREDRSDEETWVLLPDGSVLSYDIFASPSNGPGHAQRYIPSTGTWIGAGSVPVSLSSSSVGYEIGPAALLPDGRVFQVGATNKTALYDPATNSWKAGPSLPAGMGADDAPGVVLPDGRFLFAADTPLFKSPTRFFIFDPATDTLSEETPTGTLGTSLQYSVAYTGRFLMLPNGHVLFANGGNKLWDYAPTGSFKPSWAPTVSRISSDDGITYTLTGTQLTGLSAGASYGDDAEMDSNYPLVRLTDPNGVVRYARTFNWTPGVATGNALTSVQFTLPSNLPKARYTLEVVANGIPSRSIPFGTTLSIAGAQATQAEGNSGSTPFTFTVTRSGLINGTSSVDWTVQGSGDNPASPADFVGGLYPRGTIIFGEREVSKTITVSVAGDTSAEKDEGFAVALSNPTDATIGGGTANGTILNDDYAPQLSITATDANKAEGNSGTTPFLFTITRTGATDGTSTAAWVAQGSGSRPATKDDFLGGRFPAGLVSFAPGETTKTVTVYVVGDTTEESDERFTVTISSADTAVNGSSAVGTIRDDDTAPAVVITAQDARKTEGDAGTTPFTFTISRLVTTATTVVVNWAVSGYGRAAADGTDFAGGGFPSGSETFAPDETVKVITVNVAGDRTVESDESFAVAISSPGSRILSATAVGTIVNDDFMPVLDIAAADAKKPEGNAGTTPFTFTVYRSRWTSGVTLVAWSVSGTSDYPAKPDDFAGGVFPSGTIQFNPGEATKTITVLVNGDTTYETDERFAVTISSPGNAITIAAASGMILNDDIRSLVVPLVAIAQTEASSNKPRIR